MKPAVVLSLSSVLFKSHLRAGQKSKLSMIFSQPRAMLVVDSVAFLVPLALLEYVLPLIPAELAGFLEAAAWQSLVGMPMVLTSSVILAGVMFELGSSGGGVSSSEAVNWLPISPREYVAASALSMVTVYSLFLAIGMSIALPLALSFGLAHIWPFTVAFSLLAFFLGAFIVEILRAAMNRVSLTVYRRSGRAGVVSRLVLLVALFVVIQLAFNPAVLYSVLNVFAGGLEFVWFVPMVWPSVAVARLIRFGIPSFLPFAVLSIVFTFMIFEAASSLRQRYWSPAPVSIALKDSSKYLPQTPSLSILGFTPLERAIALKDLRSLIRRKDMARFITIPIMLTVAFFIPTLLAPSDISGRSPGLFLAMYLPFLTPLMLSMISVGQEGKAMINLYMLPISVNGFVKGKLLPVWTVSVIATLAAEGGFQVVAPMDTEAVSLFVLASLLVIGIEGYIGLGVGSRYPDFTVGSRSRYVTYKGFLVGFSAGGASALLIFLPTILYFVTNRGWSIMPWTGPAVPAVMILAIGLVLLYLAHAYCKKGVKRILSNLEV